MGSGKWDSNDFKTRTQTVHAGKTDQQIFSQQTLHPDLDPKNVLRESRDSADNPLSTPVIVCLDVTGSMGQMAYHLAREGLNTLVREVYQRKPVTDPHVCICAVGDVLSDLVPFQCTQFEADIRLAEQLERVYVEGNGGGNGYESYLLPWIFAWAHTRTDNWDKRKQKGFLFTIGDERPQRVIASEAIKKVFGAGPEHDLDYHEMFKLVSKAWNVFHLCLTENVTSYNERALPEWRQFLGERAIELTDHKKVPEVVVAIMQMVAGADAVMVARGFNDQHTQRVVADAVKLLPAGA